MSHFPVQQQTTVNPYAVAVRIDAAKLDLLAIIEQLQNAVAERDKRIAELESALAKQAEAEQKPRA